MWGDVTGFFRGVPLPCCIKSVYLPHGAYSNFRVVKLISSLILMGKEESS